MLNNFIQNPYARRKKCQVKCKQAMAAYAKIYHEKLRLLQMYLFDPFILAANTSTSKTTCLANCSHLRMSCFIPYNK